MSSHDHVFLALLCLYWSKPYLTAVWLPTAGIWVGHSLDIPSGYFCEYLIEVFSFLACMSCFLLSYIWCKAQRFHFLVTKIFNHVNRPSEVSTQCTILVIVFSFSPFIYYMSYWRSWNVILMFLIKSNAPPPHHSISPSHKIFLSWSSLSFFFSLEISSL